MASRVSLIVPVGCFYSSISRSTPSVVVGLLRIYVLYWGYCVVEVASKIGKWREKYGQPTGVDAEFAFHPVFYYNTNSTTQPNPQ